MAGRAVRTAIGRSGVPRCRGLRRGRLPRSDEPAAPDRLAPMRRATWPGARLRQRPDAENFGGEDDKFKISKRGYPPFPLHGAGLTPSRSAILRNWFVVSSERMDDDIALPVP